MELKTRVVCFVHLAAILIGLAWSDEEEDAEPAKPLCRTRRHVGTTLMKYPDGYVADEGPYCSCPDSDYRKDWNEKDGHSLTWQHYERGHWTVQYRFCAEVFPEHLKDCDRDRDELAALIETEVTTWAPMITLPRCRCPQNLYHLSGWKKGGKNNELWQYFYSCNKRQCPKVDSECVEITRDPSKETEAVQEVKFFCACPRDHLCPSKLEEEDKGPESKVIKKCQPILQKAKDKGNK